MTKNSDVKYVFPINMIRLCIDKYDGDIEGRVYSKMSGKGIVFKDCCEMLMKTDEMFERIGYPQSFCDGRSFVEKNKKSHYKLPEEFLNNDNVIQKQEGIVCTLDVLVHSRRQASWQGIIMGQENFQDNEFNCAIELLRCIGKIVRLNHKIPNKTIQ